MEHIEYVRLLSIEAHENITNLQSDMNNVASMIVRLRAIRDEVIADSPHMFDNPTASDWLTSALAAKITAIKTFADGL